jgi:elongation factor Ts
MSITAGQVKELREKTGVGMMQCKKALTETNGDMDAAIDLLRKQGEAVAAKRADRVANEGCVFVGEGNGKAVAAEINCETDFVGNSDDFKKLGAMVISALLNNDVADVDALKAIAVDGVVINDFLSDLLTKIGENIGIKRFVSIPVGANDSVALYQHMGGKIGVTLKIEADGAVSDKAAADSLARDLAMQVAATNPIAINGSEVDEAVIAKEREIYREQAIAAGTKADFVDRQVEGRVGKFLKEVCLTEQMFVKDNKVAIKDLLATKAKELGVGSLTVTFFSRMELGK